MDDPNTTLTSQFGHSSQELMNLLLTGRAVSNVFDNSITLSDSLTCHGVQARSDIGYLTILESLNYCEVGSNYKSPVFPIWVVGSTSHFSVLFGDEVSSSFARGSNLNLVSTVRCYVSFVLSSLTSCGTFSSTALAHSELFEGEQI